MHSITKKTWSFIKTFTYQLYMRTIGWAIAILAIGLWYFAKWLINEDKNNGKRK